MNGERDNGTRERRVIVGIQDSVAGLQALRCGVAEARRRGGTVYLARVVKSPAGQLGGVARRTELSVTAAEYAERVLVDTLGGIPRDVEVRTVALEGTAAPALVRFANGEDDLLVVGDAQRSGIRRLWSGHVARYCARWSTCPVLLVPPPALSRVDSRTLTRELRRLVDAA